MYNPFEDIQDQRHSRRGNNHSQFVFNRNRSNSRSGEGGSGDMGGRGERGGRGGRGGGCGFRGQNRGSSGQRQNDGQNEGRTYGSRRDDSETRAGSGTQARADQGNRRGGYRGNERGSREERAQRPMTYGRLKTWAETQDAGQLILFMASEKQQLESFLMGEKIKEDWLTLLVKAVNHGITAQHQKESIKQVLEVLCKSRFFDQHLVIYTIDKQDSYWPDACDFFTCMTNIIKEILEKLPKFSIKCVSATTNILNSACAVESVRENKALIDTIKLLFSQSKEGLKLAKEKDNERGQAQRGSFAKAGQDEKPPDNFLDLQVVPTKLDLQADAKPFVRCAVVDGAYESVHDYLDIQFRLMRQDFILPLRLGINEFKKNGCKVNFNSSDLRMYYNVHIVGTVFKDGIDHILQFDVSKLGSVKWEFSKRLIFGSLLCLSKDNFETVIFATVAHHDAAQLAKGNVTVNVKSGLDIVFNSTSSDVFVMAETTAYFESYVHVLEGLQEMAKNLPLQDYLISCKKDVKPPKYLLPSGGIRTVPVYNLSSLLINPGFMDSFPVLTTVRWPPAVNMCLNTSQREAAMAALTKEIAVIQGPPGTGKTYVGLKVMQVLIENKNVMAGNLENQDDPILVVCYTNHALDQFLEGVLNFCKDGIVRVGGKNSNESLEKFNIKSLRQKVRNERLFSDRSVRNSKYECLKELEVVSEEISKLNKTMDSLETDIQTEQILENFMQDQHFDSLQNNCPDPGRSRQRMRQWLNASNDTPQSALPKMIQQHMTNLVLQVREVSQAMLQQKMDIWQRASLYNCWLSMYKSRMQQEFQQSMFHDQRLAVEINKNLEVSQTKILSDDLLQWVLPASVFKDISSILISYKYKPVSGSLVEAWVLGLYNSLDNQLDEIQVLASRLKGETVDVDVFDETDTGQQDQQNLVDDDDDDDGTGNYNAKINNARNTFISVMQRAEMMGISEEIMKDDEKDDGWTVKSYTKPLTFGKIRNKLKTVEPMTVEEETKIFNVWNLDLNKKFALYNSWVKRYKESLTEKMIEFVQRYQSAYDRKMEANREETLYILKKAKVIGMTTTGAAKHRAVLQSVACRIIVVEEAAEVLESHIVTALNKECNHLILIGDHQQLRPNPTVYELAKDYKLEISLFERLINNKVPHTLLKEQHRMRPEISKIMKHIYNHLEDHSSVLKYEHIRGVGKDVFFIKHKELETKVDDTRSKANSHEAKYLVALCKYLLLQGYESSQITILATYTGQVFAIKKLTRENSLQVRVTAVDNFQGEENDIILLSLVRSNEQNSVGFLKVDNRVCVALSRAKKGLFVIGNFDLLFKHSELWRKIIKTATEDGIIGEGLPVVCQNHPEIKQDIVTSQDFDKCPEGGCGNPCNFRLNCGHVCAKKCHGYDLDHKQYQCKKPCPKRCAEGGHPCRRKCFQDCGNCEELVNKIIPICGHEDKVPCYQAPIKAVCSQKCSALLDCEHLCLGKCGVCKKNGQHGKCNVSVEYSWPCGHTARVPCHLKPSENPCQKVCDAVLECGHKCKGKCSDCLDGAVHVACEEKCQEVLPCGHKCEGYCGVPCVPCTQPCPSKCAHGSCTTPKSKIECGHKCPDCLEKCSISCPHGSCIKTCHEKCSKEPCKKPCDKKVHICSEKCGGRKNCKLKLQNCNHNCFGMCGELCVCGHCEKISVMPHKGGKQTDNTTSSDGKPKVDREKRLLKIPSCNHIFYLDDLDEYVLTFDPAGTSYIPCPACKQPITKCVRYENINKERSKRREVKKEELRGKNQLTKTDQEKLLQSKRLVDDTHFSSLKYIDVSNAVEKQALCLQLKYAFVLGEILSLPNSSSEHMQLFKKMREAVLKVKRRLTKQQREEFSTELLRCFRLAYLTQMETDSRLNGVDVPPMLQLQVQESLEVLRKIKPDLAKFHRSGYIIETLKRVIDDRVKSVSVKAKCQLMTEAYTRVDKVITSKDDEMLCDIVKQEEKLTSRFSDLSIAAPRASSASSSLHERLREKISLGLSSPPSTLQETLAAKKKADLLERLSAREQLLSSSSLERHREKLALKEKERSMYVSDLKQVSRPLASPYGIKHGARNLADSSDSDSDLEVERNRYLTRTRRCSGDSD
ncbi:NFX1-type zinc finger-containing protein 1-like [Physella acuta]|uniref:NFX1-type zinc finger-containing protein 1-like n=1 Tax=Physella acuta TaxID=109671 RepID=UPI0027DDA8C3|nr:NFX1-type zinc finger-containing protein 1-like [Physella acuta]